MPEKRGAKRAAVPPLRRKIPPRRTGWIPNWE